MPRAARIETFAIPGAQPSRALLRGRGASLPRDRTDALRPRALSMPKSRGMDDVERGAWSEKTTLVTLTDEIER